MQTQNESLAPVALFIFKRPEHTRRTILSLQSCKEFARSPIYIFADGPRGPADEAGVSDARRVARDLLGERPTYVESPKNKGLATSVIEGVSDICERHGRVIVVEDDLVVAHSFLVFMNEALVRYADDERVMQVSGYMVDVPALRHAKEAQLLPFPTSWGWATWHRAWLHFDPAATGWQALASDPSARRAFDLDGHFPYTRMLERQMHGELDSWAVRWYYSVFKNGGLVLFPPRTLVHNTGHDGSGTHSSQASHVSEPEFAFQASFVLPDNIEESRYKRDVYRAYRRTLMLMRMRKVASTFSSIWAKGKNRLNIGQFLN